MDNENEFAGESIGYINNTLSPYENYQQIDVVVSRDCTLRCEYCYLHKHKDDRYDRDAILESVDKLLNFTHNDPEHKKDGVVMGFYPEPWVNIEKSNQLIADTLKLLLKYPRFNKNFMIMLGTNGVRLDQEIPILKNILDHLSISVTIDGIKEQHDLYRVFKDGTGSWDLVVKNVKKYQKRYNIYTTKVTIGPETIKYMYDSVLYLWNELNIIDINMNVVFEDLWGTEKEKAESLIEYEKQLDKITNYVIANKLWEGNKKFIGVVGGQCIPAHQRFKGSSPDNNDYHDTFSPRPYCGAGVMRSIDVDGGIYPCFRLSPFSLNKPSPFRLDESLTDNSSRALNMFNAYDAAPKKCLECPYLPSCSMCVGGAMEEKSSLFWRTTHHCDFLKLQYKYALKILNTIHKLNNLEELESVF